MTQTKSIIEFKLRPAARYVLTRFSSDGKGGVSVGSVQCAEFTERSKGIAVGKAMAASESGDADSVSFEDVSVTPTLNDAVAQLEISADNCENNAPIYEKEGNAEQAKLSRDNAASYRAAIDLISGVHGGPSHEELLAMDTEALLYHFEQENYVLSIPAIIALRTRLRTLHEELMN